MAYDKAKLAAYILRIGIAVAFLYAPIASILEPASWMGFIPSWLSRIIPATLFLVLFSAYQLALALWLISGKKTFAASILSIATLFAITAANITVLNIVFRDISILFAALALAALEYRRR